MSPSSTILAHCRILCVSSFPTRSSPDLSIRWETVSSEPISVHSETSPLLDGPFDFKDSLFFHIETRICCQLLYLNWYSKSPLLRTNIHLLENHSPIRTWNLFCTFSPIGPSQRRLKRLERKWVFSLVFISSIQNLFHVFLLSNS